MNKKNLLRFSVHLLALCILFVLPEVMMGVGSRHMPGGMEWRFYVKALVYVAVFYVEYYLILGRGSDRRMLGWRFFVCNVVLLAISTVVIKASHLGMPPHARMDDPGQFMWVRDVGIVVLTISLAVAIRLSERVHLLEQRRREMDDARRSAELVQLKSQLNPHFLFNALNTIYALTEIDADKARTAVHTLSRMLRYALYYAERPSVELGREIDFIRDYISMMELRLAGSVTVKTRLECQDSARSLPIAPMLFISIVENAFKHGVSGHRGDMISISLTADSSGAVECLVDNTVNGRDEADSTAAHGLGLTNLRRRLELIYGDGASLDVSEADGLYSVRLFLRNCTGVTPL